jgi:hypothetical protein
MEKFEEPIAEATRAIGQLETEMLADMDPLPGGFRWWDTYPLSDEERCDLSDYLYATTAATSTNLGRAAISLLIYRQARFSDDRFILDRPRSGGNDIPNLHRTGHDAERDARLGVALDGVFSNCVSAMDTLTAVIVGVGGLQEDIVKTDFGRMRFTTPYEPLSRWLADSDGASAIAQHELLRSVYSAFVAAGPPDWFPWMRETRNRLIHRGGRSSMIIWNTDRTICRPQFRQPSLPESVDLRAARDLTDSLLDEDSLKTLEGLVSSLNAAVAASIEACRSLWLRRRARPELIAQPSIQWQSGKRSTKLSFAGYTSGGIRQGKNAKGYVSPTYGRRLAAGNVLRGATGAVQ